MGGVVGGTVAASVGGSVGGVGVATLTGAAGSDAGTATAGPSPLGASQMPRTMPPTTSTAPAPMSRAAGRPRRGAGASCTTCTAEGEAGSAVGRSLRSPKPKLSSAVARAGFPGLTAAGFAARPCPTDSAVRVGAWLNCSASAGACTVGGAAISAAMSAASSSFSTGRVGARLEGISSVGGPSLADCGAGATGPSRLSRSTSSSLPPIAEGIGSGGGEGACRRTGGSSGGGGGAASSSSARGDRGRFGFAEGEGTGTGTGTGTGIGAGGSPRSMAGVAIDTAAGGGGGRGRPPDPGGSGGGGRGALGRKRSPSTFTVDAGTQSDIVSFQTKSSPLRSPDRIMSRRRSSGIGPA